eukprot:scaffold8775_cov170-Skeletonema_marinoi.AAC.1
MWRSSYQLENDARSKSQSLNFINGYMMAKHPPGDDMMSKSDSHCRYVTAPISTEKEVDDPTDVSGRYSITRKKADRDNNNLALPFCPESKLPSFIEHDRRVLLFNAYYEEDVHQSLEEEKILHACEIYFYVEDGTMEIIQTKTENSGIVQGKFLRRSKVVKPGTSSCHYGIDDLKIGNTLDIYCRSFRVVNCNESTRRYVLEHHGWCMHDVQPIPLPRDHFAEMNRAKMIRESGVPGLDRKRKMNDLKVVMESQLGKQSSMTDRGMFLEHGTDALCFHVTWDDRSRLYGNIQYFRLIYHLADDTIEIARASNTTRDGTVTFPKLLKRSKLPTSLAFDDSDCYSWKDLAIGQIINVFGRMMLIVKCDRFTRDHYESNGIHLREDMPLEVEDKKAEIKRVVPPYNGFGSEEDSLRSCTGSINPPPLKKDMSSNKKSGIVLRFNASLVVDDDADDSSSMRKFAINFFLEDDTITIHEPPIKNSGYVGGQFLRRQPINHISASDMYVGNVVEVVGHQFLLRDANESTFKLMECDEKTFPYSDTARLQRILSSKQDTIRAYFVNNYDGDGMLDLEGLRQLCSAIGIVINHAELITIWRRLQRNNTSDSVPFNKLLKFSAEETFIKSLS